MEDLTQAKMERLSNAAYDAVEAHGLLSHGEARLYGDGILDGFLYAATYKQRVELTEESVKELVDRVWHARPSALDRDALSQSYDPDAVVRFADDLEAEPVPGTSAGKATGGTVQAIENEAGEVQALRVAGQDAAPQAVENYPAHIWRDVVSAAWAHPMWSHYEVAVVHLRDYPGQRTPAQHAFEGSTHELFIIALDPKDNKTWLLPLNMAVQARFHVNGDTDYAKADHDARLWGQRVLEAIRTMNLNPDTDYMTATGKDIERMARDIGADHAAINLKPGA